MMNFDVIWAEPAEKLENNGEKELFLMSLRDIHPSISSNLPSLKKIQLPPLSNELATSSLLELEFVSERPHTTDIKPPPPIFTDLWGNSVSSSGPDEALQTGMSNLKQIVEETQGISVSENTLFVPGEKSKATTPLELDRLGDEQWENEPPISEETPCPYGAPPNMKMTLDPTVRLQ